MKNKTELQITKTLKYEALYIVLGFEEIVRGVFQKKYATTKITVNTNLQTVDFDNTISVINGVFLLGDDKSFVVLECVDRLLSIGYSPLEIVIDLDNEYDIYIRNIYIRCYEWDWTQQRVLNTNSICNKNGTYLSVLYESRTYSGLIERRYSVYDGHNIYHAGLFESTEIHLRNEVGIINNDPNFIIEGKKLVSYTGKDQRVSLPEGIEEIQSACFWDNQDIEEVILPLSLKNLGGDTFYNCSNLRRLTIPANVETMGNNPFAGCSRLELKNESMHYVFENGLLMDKSRKRIIYYQITLKNEECIIPNSVQIIGKHAFYLGVHLKKMTLPKSVRRLENNPFSGCMSLDLKSDSPNYAIEENIIYTSDFKTLVGTVGTIQKNPLIIKNVETISRNSFWNHNEIHKIVLPKTLKQIGYNPFVGCSNIDFTSYSPNYPVKDGILYNKDFSKLICCPSRLAKGSFHIIDCVRKLERGAFSGCKELSKIYFRNVFSIGKNCFTDCVSLKEVYIPDFVKYIGEWAFSHCSSLKKFSYYEDCYLDKYILKNSDPQIIVRQERSNYLVESENFFTLESLAETQKGKIKSILIDPPYNSHIDYIGYRDDFKTDYHNFMKKRIVISKELLSENGFLLMNIDKGEFKSLLKLCKDIFGSKLVSYIKWKKMNKNFDQNRIVLNQNKKQTRYEYIICCKKSKAAKFNKIRQPYIWKGRVIEKERNLPFILDNFGTTSSAKDEIAVIFGERTYFSTPKPLKLMKELIRATTDKDSIVMDYFAGSGTVGDACFELNNEDGGKRNFILVSNSENDICKRVTNERLKKSAIKNSGSYEFLC